eukprot:5752413-Prymnesium_polylepis.1
MARLRIQQYAHIAGFDMKVFRTTYSFENYKPNKYVASPRAGQHVVKEYNDDEPPHNEIFTDVTTVGVYARCTCPDQYYVADTYYEIGDCTEDMCINGVVSDCDQSAPNGNYTGKRV